MKKQVIKQAKTKKVEINTNNKNIDDEVFDSEEFDAIPQNELIRIFTDKYNQHKKALLDLALSRLALSSAIKNVDSSINNNMENPILLDSDTTSDLLDNGFTLALIAYGYKDAFSFITDEQFRNEIITTLITGKKVAKPTGAKPPVGYSKAVSDVEKDLNEIQNSLKTTLEKDNDKIYGDIQNGNTVGIVGRQKK